MLPDKTAIKEVETLKLVRDSLNSLWRVFVAQQVAIEFAEKLLVKEKNERTKKANRSTRKKSKVHSVVVEGNKRVSKKAARAKAGKRS